jgi:hypothetical protein
MGFDSGVDYALQDVMASTSEWPIHFPANCPDSSTTPTNGAFFRLVDGSDEDYKSWLELKRGNGSDCRRASLSCFIDLEIADATRRA